MKPALFRNQLLIKKSLIHGYGVFADQDIEPGSIIEECYFLPRKEKDAVYEDYYFTTGTETVFPLGYGSLYNHADKPNADYDFDLLHSLLVIRANCVIKKGEEILISYGDNWFSSRQQACKYPLRYTLRRYQKTMQLLLRFLLITGFLFSSIAMFKTFF